MGTRSYTRGAQGTSQRHLEPELSYEDAMKLRSKQDGHTVREMYDIAFALLLEHAIMGVDDNFKRSAIRSQLMGHSWRYTSDKWHALLVLMEHGVDLKQWFR